MIIAIDGPAGAGKSTVAKKVAQRCGFVVVDTGAIYRALAWQALQQGVALTDEPSLVILAQQLAIRFVEGSDGISQVWLGETDLTQAIRTASVGRAVSVVSAHPGVRRELVALQRTLAGRGNAVLEGRDIGTVICPHAPVKFFLVASAQERARRRHEELLARGETASYAEVLADIETRDAGDINRAVAPLKAAEDAIRLDCTRLSPDDVVDAIVARVLSVQAELSEPSAEQISRAAPTASPSQWQAAIRFFTHELPTRLAAPSAPVPAGTFLFVIVDGERDLRFKVDGHAKPPQIKPADPQDEAECTFYIPLTRLLALLAGTLNPQLAFMQGHLRVQGDLALAMHLGAMFG